MVNALKRSFSLSFFSLIKCFVIFQYGGFPSSGEFDENISLQKKTKKKGKKKRKEKKEKRHQ